MEHTNAVYAYSEKIVDEEEMQQQHTSASSTTRTITIALQIQSVV